MAGAEDADNEDEQTGIVDDDDDNRNDVDDENDNYQVAGAEDADNEDEQARNVPLSLLPLAGVVIPQARRLKYLG